MVARLSISLISYILHYKLSPGRYPSKNIAPSRYKYTSSKKSMSIVGAVVAMRPIISSSILSSTIVARRVVVVSPLVRYGDEMRAWF